MAYQLEQLKIKTFILQWPEMFCLFPLVWKLCLWVFRVGAAFYAIAYHAIRIVVKIWKLLPRATTKHYRPVFFYPQLVNCFLTHKKVVQFNHWTNQHDKQAGIQLSLGAKLIRRQATGAASHRSNYKQATAFNANSEIHWFKASIGGKRVIFGNSKKPSVVFWG